MNDCRRTVEGLTPYVDGTLPPSDREAIDTHLADCPACRRAVMDAQGARSVLRQCAPRLSSASVPPGLKSRCEALAREHCAAHAGRSAGWGRFFPALAIAMIVVATSVVLFQFATARSNVVLAQQLTIDHTKCHRLFGSSTEMDAHVAADQLEKSYGWRLTVPPSSPSVGLTLVGARRCLYASGTIPHVLYRAGDEELSLFVLEGDRDADDVLTFGHRSHIWSDGRRTFVLVGSPETRNFDRAAEYMERAAR